jgi:hypothetical protein
MHMHSAAGIGKVRTAPRDYFERLRAPDHPLTDDEKKIALAEIKSRYAALREKYRSEAAQFRFITFMRVGDLESIFEDRYGLHLPDDDAGRDDLVVMANHLAHYGGAPETVVGRVVEWAALHAPTISTDRVTALASKVAARPIKWSADKLAWRMRLTMEDRTRLGITTIGAFDVGKKDRPEWLAAHHRKRKADDRRSEGVPTRAEWLANSDTANEWWKAMGMSRRTWYRKGKPMSEAGHGTKPAPEAARGTGLADHIERQRPAEAVPTRTASGAAAAQEAVQEEAAIESAATPGQQRAGGNTAPAAEAPQPPIEIVPFLNWTVFEGTKAGRLGDERGREQTPGSTLRQQMIAFQRAVRSSPGMGWLVPARRGPIGVLNLRGGGAPAPYRWPRAASGGAGGRMEPKRLVGRE